MHELDDELELASNSREGVMAHMRIIVLLLHMNAEQFFMHT